MNLEPVPSGVAPVEQAQPATTEQTSEDPLPLETALLGFNLPPLSDGVHSVSPDPVATRALVIHDPDGAPILTAGLKAAPDEKGPRRWEVVSLDSTLPTPDRALRELMSRLQSEVDVSAQTTVVDLTFPGAPARAPEILEPSALASIPTTETVTILQQFTLMPLFNGSLRSFTHLKEEDKQTLESIQERFPGYIETRFIALFEPREDKAPHPDLAALVIATTDSTYRLLLTTNEEREGRNSAYEFAINRQSGAIIRADRHHLSNEKPTVAPLTIDIRRIQHAVVQLLTAVAKSHSGRDPNEVRGYPQISLRALFDTYLHPSAPDLTADPELPLQPPTWGEVETISLTLTITRMVRTYLRRATYYVRRLFPPQD